MSRVEWLKWVIFEHPGPTSRIKQLRLFLAFELYSLGCRLSGQRVVHFLKQESLPAGRYILIKPPVPVGVRLLDRLFKFGEETHLDYVPYTPEAAEEMRRAGQTVQVIEIAYRIVAGGSR